MIIFHVLHLKIMSDIKKGIQYAFQTENNMTIALSGSGHAAMECAVFNTVEPGENVLIAINGIWGERVAEIAERMGMSLRSFTHTTKISVMKLDKPKSVTMFNKCQFLCQVTNVFLIVGANVHRMVKAPGGYFSNKEIEQVGTYYYCYYYI